MVIISNMDIQHNIWYLHLNLIISTNGKVSDVLIMMLITVSLAPTAGVLFTTNTMILIILNKTENR